MNMMNPIINNNKNNWGYYVDIETQTILNEHSILFLDAPIKLHPEVPKTEKQLKNQVEKQVNHIISYVGLTFIICIIISF